MNVSAVEILLFIAGYSEKLKGGICNDSLILDEFNNWAWFDFISWFETHWSSRIRILINTRINMKLVFDDFESRTWYQITEMQLNIFNMICRSSRVMISIHEMKDSGQSENERSGNERYDVTIRKQTFMAFRTWQIWHFFVTIWF